MDKKNGRGNLSDKVPGNLRSERMKNSPSSKSPVGKNASSNHGQNPVRNVQNNNTRTVGRREKRRNYRVGNYALYYVLIIIVIVIVFIILANTVLFKCTRINVSGNVKYTSDEIIEKSGLQIGENLLKINVTDARDNIVASLAYIDDAEVKKSFPTNINITVTEAEKAYCISEGGVTAAISRKGKILEHCEAGDLPIVKGFEPESLETGRWLKSKTEGKTELPESIFKAADKTSLKNITEIDITDKFSIKVVVENRVILNLGSADEIESKFLVAVELINNQLGKDEYVTILLSNPEKVPVQNNSVPQQSKPVSSSSSSSVKPTEQDPEPEVDPEPEIPAE